VHKCWCGRMYGAEGPEPPLITAAVTNVLTVLTVTLPTHTPSHLAPTLFLFLLPSSTCTAVQHCTQAGAGGCLLASSSTHTATASGAFHKGVWAG
jgi:hypothetical protein